MHRNKERRHWPKYLTMIGENYYFEDPRKNGSKIPLGKSLDKAKSDAIKAIAWLDGELAKTGIVEKLNGSAGETMAEWLVTYKQKLADRQKYKPATWKSYNSRLSQIEDKLGDQVLRKLTALDGMTFLEVFTNSGRKAHAVNLMKLLIDVGDVAVTSGRLDVNPFEKLDLAKPDVKRSRLSLEEFKRIYAKAASMQPWVQNSMALALVSGQRLSDIEAAQFPKFHDGAWHLIQLKGSKPTQVRIPFTLGLNVLGWTLGDVVKRCRDKVVSKHLIHHVRHLGDAKPGMAVAQKRISSAFSEARDLAGIVCAEGKTPVTFHELRSLAQRLYRAQKQETESFMGKMTEEDEAEWTEVDAAEVNTQTLLGHKQAQTTEIYNDPRDGGRPWKDVKIGRFPKNSPRIPSTNRK